jgi:hypothetical protein
MSADKFRTYAEECVRIAHQMTGKSREALLEIAEAWTRCAQMEDERMRKDKRAQLFYPKSDKNDKNEA